MADVVDAFAAFVSGRRAYQDNWDGHANPYGWEKRERGIWVMGYNYERFRAEQSKANSQPANPPHY